jgi:hypothetical protein
VAAWCGLLAWSWRAADGRIDPSRPDESARSIRELGKNAGAMAVGFAILAWATGDGWAVVDAVVTAVPPLEPALSLEGVYLLALVYGPGLAASLSVFLVVAPRYDLVRRRQVPLAADASRHVLAYLLWTSPVPVLVAVVVAVPAGPARAGAILAAGVGYGVVAPRLSRLVSRTRPPTAEERRFVAATSTGDPRLAVVVDDAALAPVAAAGIVPGARTAFLRDHLLDGAAPKQVRAAVERECARLEAHAPLAELAVYTVFLAVWLGFGASTAWWITGGAATVPVVAVGRRLRRRLERRAERRAADRTGSRPAPTA